MAAIKSVPLEGPKFQADARTVHQILLNNINEDSDAYTYIKTLLRHRDGRRDIQALRERYSSESSKHAIINAAKSSIERLRYKNERAFSFEKFSAKLQKAYDDLESNGRPVHNGDIVDALWPMILDSSLATYLASLKVDYQKNPRNYKSILQDIAGEVASSTKTVTFAPGTRGVSATYTRQGNFPNKGVHTPDGSIFIGLYQGNRWFSKSVKPYHDEINEARKNNPATQPNDDGNGGNQRKRRANAIKIFII